jgi:2-methylisocitrate lyase-like PEP mutase family enzyme
MHQQTKAQMLHGLHAGPQILVLPNAWDAVSARIIASEGFPAIATSSAAVAWVLGYPDGQRIPRREMLFMVGKIAQAVDVPVTADVEAGYDDPAQTAHDVIAAGVVGLNLEDMVAHELVPLARQLETIVAVLKEAKRARVRLVLNARTDIFLAKHGDESTRFSRAVERLNAYYDAGADCLFAPGVTDARTIEHLVAQLKGPLNVLAGVGTPPIAELQRLGVKRLSLGSGTYRMALGALQHFARQIREKGTMEAEAVPYLEVQQLFS